MPLFATRSSCIAALLVLCTAAMAQPSRWVPLPGVGLGKDVSAIQFDRRGLVEVENHNADDDRAYPVALVLVDFSRERDSGMLGSYHRWSTPSQSIAQVAVRKICRTGSTPRPAAWNAQPSWGPWRSGNGTRK